MAVYRLPFSRRRGPVPDRITPDDRFWRAEGRSEGEHASLAALLLAGGIVLGSMLAFNYLESPRGHSASMAPTSALYEVVSSNDGSR